MTYVITQGCIADTSCIAVCPVQSIRPRPGDPEFTTTEQMYIDPATCIDCGACVAACPVDAIVPDYEIDDDTEPYLEINAEYFQSRPIEPEDLPIVPTRTLPAERPSLKVAVIGAGASGCYTAAELSAIRGVEVTLIDRLPTPYGLIRSGVAPDHQKTKLAGDQFRSVLSRKNVTCLFNVEVGRDITVQELRASHHAVVFAYGAVNDRRLEVPGEHLSGVHSAREFVAWYNGHPDQAAAEVSLQTERVVIIGNGNVALEIARLLTLPVAKLEKTDVADHALDALRASRVREVVVVGRRGPEHAAFTSSEILAMSRLEGIDLIAQPDDVVDPSDYPNPVRRKLEVVAAAAASSTSADRRRVSLRFGLVPMRVNGDARVTSVTFTGAGGAETTIEAGMVIRAIGYRGEPLDGIPFLAHAGRLAHDRGRLVEDEGAALPGQYCVGWIKRGPRGFIGSNRVDAQETVASVLEDFEAGVLPEPEGQDAAAILGARGVEVVDAAGWQRINAAELDGGKRASRSRSKFVSIDELLAASRP